MNSMLGQRHGLAEITELSQEEVLSLLWRDWAMFLEWKCDVDGEPLFTFYHDTYTQFLNTDPQVMSTFRA